ncbi:YhgE/Pip domain-containing protein [Leucobacter tardus]
MLGVILVPLTIAGVLLWGLWNPQDRLDTVSAAVVNLDEPAEVDGQTVPLGRLLAGELIGDGSDDDAQNFSWQLTDASEAAAGLDAGRYATVVTIPENFSSAATSLSSDPENPEQARITVDSSDRGRLIDNALTGVVTATATSLLNQQLGEQFVGGVFVGMTEIGNGVGAAADGARELADGGTQLAGGASQLADGTEQLVTGTDELSRGANELAGGANEAASGVQQLASGMAAFAGGVGEFAAGARTAATGQQQLADGVREYTGGVNQAIDAIAPGAAEVQEQLGGLIAAIEGGAIPVPDEQREQVLVELRAAQSGLGDGIGQLGTLRASGEQLATAAQQSADGSAELATAAEGLAGGAHELSAGAQTAAGGVSQLAGGAGALAGGTSQLASQTPELAAGASQLATGTRASADGAGDLADGLVDARQQIPDYSESERDRIAETAITPVSAEGESGDLFTAAGAPLFAGIALWAGGLAMFLLLAPLWRRTREAALGVGRITMHSIVPALALGAAQGAIAGIVLPVALGYEPGQALRFAGLALLAGVVFGLVNQGLSALLGGFGRFIAFLLLVVAFAVGVVATVPGPLQTIGGASPVGAALDGFGAVATGASGTGLAVFLLVLWGLSGIVLTAFAVVRERRTTRPV